LPIRLFFSCNREEGVEEVLFSDLGAGRSDVVSLIFSIKSRLPTGTAIRRVRNAI
jgi:hypothetical protein